MQPKAVSARRPAALPVAEIGDFCFADDGKGAVMLVVGCYGLWLWLLARISGVGGEGW